jgi:hypothetical protein
MSEIPTKEPAEIKDFSISYALIFADDDPDDQIASSAWVVTLGDIVVDSDRIEGTDKAIARISGGTKYGSFQEAVNTITCISGQKYVRTLRIQIAKIDVLSL